MSTGRTESVTGAQTGARDQLTFPDEPHAHCDEDNNRAEPFVHPEARVLFARCPWIEKIPVFGIACRGYGPRCTIALGVLYLLSKGLGNTLLSQARYAMFTDRFHTDATRYQRLSAIASMGSSIKAFIAMISDSLALFGYTKRWYCAGSCVLGAVMTVVYATLPTKESSANIAAGVSFLSSFSIMNIDILVEGHYSRLMRKVPESGPAVVSWIYWFILGAGIIAAAIQGPLSDAKMPQVGLYISAAAQIIPIVFFLLNWFGERTNRTERYEDARRMHEELLQLTGAKANAPDAQKDMHPELAPAEPATREALADAEDDDLVLGDELSVSDTAGELAYEMPHISSCCGGVVELNKEVIKRNWRIFLYSILMTCIVITIMLVTILGDSWALLYTACAVLVIGCGFGFFALPLVVAKVNVFVYFHLLLYLQLPGAINSFYLATPDCVADAPHFTYTFYNTIAGIIGNIGGIVGVTCFNYLFSKRSYRFTFIITTCIQVLASIFDIIIIKRWNIYIGIPDHAMYMLGDAVVYEVVYYIAWMPIIILMSRICPRGSEAMVYALVGGFANLGTSMSSTLGSLLMELAWPIDTKSRPCDFSNLVILVVVGHLCMPLLNVPMAFLLLPPVRMCDDMDIDGHAVLKEAEKNAKATTAEPLASSTSDDDAARRAQ